MFWKSTMRKNGGGDWNYVLDNNMKIRWLVFPTFTVWLDFFFSLNSLNKSVKVKYQYTAMENEIHWELEEMNCNKLTTKHGLEQNYKPRLADTTPPRFCVLVPLSVYF